MLTPDYLLHVSEGAEDIAEMLHQDILNRIVERMMRRIGRGDDYLLTAVDKWNLEVLQDAGYLLEDIQREIAKRTKLQEQEIRDAMTDAGVRAMKYDDAIYKAAGLDPAPFMQSPYLMRLMQRNYEATMGEWKNFTRTTAEASQRTFINALDKAYHLTSSGALGYTQAVREAVEEMARTGIEVIYPSGRKMTIEAATLMCVRTGISQATGQIQTARMDEMGVDLVLVSAHLGARPSHQVWQGKVYSRSGNSKKYPDFVKSTGYGTVEGLCGANCRHNFGPYFEGMENPFDHYDSEENLKAYEIQQRQRTLERRIRNTKREVMALKTAIDNTKDNKLKFEMDMDYQRKAALLQKQNQAYNDFCEENDLKRLADRLSIAKWNRAQAASARGAAQRYKTAKSTPAAPSRKTGTTVSILGKSTDEYTPKQKADIENLIEHAPKKIKDAFAKYGSQFQKADRHLDKSRSKAPAYFDPLDGRVHMNRQNAAAGNNYEAKYQQHFHEYAHNLDYLAGNGNYASLAWRSQNGEMLEDIIEKDWDNALESFFLSDAEHGYNQNLEMQLSNGGMGGDQYLRNVLYTWRRINRISRSDSSYLALKDELDSLSGTKRSFRQYWEKHFGTFKDVVYINYADKKDVLDKFITDIDASLSEIEKGDLSDMIERYAIKIGGTSYEYPLGFGHGEHYALIAGKLTKEAFAEMTSASITNPDSLTQIKKYLPNAYNAYIDILKGMT